MIEIKDLSKITQKFEALRGSAFASKKSSSIEPLQPITVSHTLFPEDSLAYGEETTLDFNHLSSNELLDPNPHQQQIHLSWFFTLVQSTLPLRTQSLAPFTERDALYIAHRLGGKPTTKINRQVYNEELFDRDYTRRVLLSKERLQRLEELSAPRLILEETRKRLQRIEPAYPIGHERFVVTKLVTEGVALQIRLNDLQPGRHKDVSLENDVPTFPDFPEVRKTPVMVIKMLPVFGDLALSNRTKLSEALNSHPLNGKGSRGEIVERVIKMYSELYSNALSAVRDERQFDLLPQIVFGN